MALRKNIEAQGSSVVKTEFGDIANGEQKVSFSSYIKVVAIHGDKLKVKATVLFSGLPQSFTRHYDVPVSVENGAKNFIAQTYDCIKTLPEFAGATDC